MSLTVYTNAIQKLRVVFGVGGALIYTSVLDMGRLWERLLRRAEMPLAYSQGFTPHPRLQFASALPVGYSSECEIVDISLGERVDPEAFLCSTRAQAPPGLEILRAQEIPLRLKSPQSTMREAHYRVCVWSDDPSDVVRTRLGELLNRSQITYTRTRKGQPETRDLRPLIHDICLEASGDGCHRLRVIVRCGPNGAGRPEEILKALELEMHCYTIHRYRLVWQPRQES